MTMRGTLGAAGGLLLVAGTLIAASTDAQAVGGLNTVTVSPGHGKAAAQFQVSYTISPCQQAAGLTIGFSWSGLTPVGQVLGTAATDTACRATLTTRPPANAATHQAPAPGSYQVFGYVALPTGDPAPNTEASTSYTVDVTPAPTATATPTQSASSAPSASAPAGTAAPSASAPAGSDQPGTVGTPRSAAGKPAVYGSNRDAGWWTLAWPVLGASVVALAILAAMGLGLAWMVRRGRARAAQGPSNDKAA